MQLAIYIANSSATRGWWPIVTSDQAIQYRPVSLTVISIHTPRRNFPPPVSRTIHSILLTGGELHVTCAQWYYHRHVYSLRNYSYRQNPMVSTVKYRGRTPNLGRGCHETRGWWKGVCVLAWSTVKYKVRTPSSGRGCHAWGNAIASLSVMETKNEMRYTCQDVRCDSESDPDTYADSCRGHTTHGQYKGTHKTMIQIDMTNIII